MSPEETRMIEAIDRSREKLHKIARRIWEFKEVGWEEFKFLSASDERAGTGRI